MLIDTRGELVTDNFHYVDDEQSLNLEVPVIVSLARLKLDGDHLESGAVQFGVIITCEDDITALLNWLPSLGVIDIQFPAFADGRGFSQAKRLRQTYGYSGEIRASGDILPDQLQYLEQCGFNSIALKDDTARYQQQMRFTVDYRAL